MAEHPRDYNRWHLIEQQEGRRSMTVIVGPDGRFRIDEQLNLIVELREGQL